MLTGPVTILQWSFVRDDQPRAETAKQLALAIRDEVKDLEAAGIRVIQIDEPALREGLPLKRAEWPTYLEWAVNAFRLATSSVSDATQIHTHMCYSEFHDDTRVSEKMDADHISSENARTGSEPRVGGVRAPARHTKRVGRDPDSHTHVLQRVQRRHPGDREDGRGRHLDRERALGLRAAGGVPRVQIPQRDRAWRVRHPLTARPELGRDRRGLEAHAGRAARPADLGEPRLRPKDAGLGRDARGAA